MAGFDALLNLSGALRGGHMITWKKVPGRTGDRAEHVLRAYRVQILGRHTPMSSNIQRDELGITVKPNARRWAEYLLIRGGFHITSELHPANEGIRGENYGTMPEQWQDGMASGGIVGGIVTGIAGGLLGRETDVEGITGKEQRNIRQRAAERTQRRNRRRGRRR